MSADSPTVVVVDNSPAIRKLFELSTGDLDINLVIHTTAREAWKYLEKTRPELLFLSIILPDKNGLTMLQDLRKLPLHQHTSVIIISSKDYTQDRKVASGLDVLEYITKPVSMQTIKDVVVKYTRAKAKPVQ